MIFVGNLSVVIILLFTDIYGRLSMWEYEDFVLEQHKRNLLMTLAKALVYCYQFDLTHLLSIHGDEEQNFHLIWAKLNFNSANMLHAQVFLNDLKLKFGKHENFDLSNEVESWFKNGTQQILLKLHFDQPYSEFVQPILSIKAGKYQNCRQKREVRYDRDCSNRKCCLKTRYFQFQKSGFEHISAPDGFIMNFCEGICNQTLIPAINDRSALVRTLKTSNSKFNPLKHKWVCCVPIKFTSISVIEWNNEGLQRSFRLKNVKVTQCGCVI